MNQAAPEQDKLVIQIVRLLIASHGELDEEQISDEKIASWIDQLDIVNQGRVKYLETLGSYLYEGLRPFIMRDVAQTPEVDEKEEATSPLDLPPDIAPDPPEIVEEAEEELPRSLAPQPEPAPEVLPRESIFPQRFEVPTATAGKAYEFHFDIQAYYDGGIEKSEIEGLDSLRGISFDSDQLVLSGTPTEPGVFDLSLSLLRSGQSERDIIPFHLTIEPDFEALPALIEMPVGMINRDYDEKVQLDRAFKFNFRLEGGEQAGMEFDPDTMMLVGTPTQEGTYEFQLHFFWEGMRESLASSVKIAFEVEEQQAAYWKNILPDPNSRFSKSLEEKKLVDANNHWLIGASIRGQRHQHLGLHREDDFQLKYSKRLGWSILALADGHPQATFARKGSDLATKVAQQVVGKRLEDYFASEETSLEELLTQAEEDDTQLKRFLNFTLTTAIYNSYLYIKRFATSESVPIEEFNTTLKLAIAFPLKKKGYFVAGTAMGAGAIGIFSEKNHHVQLIRDDLTTLEDVSFTYKP